MTVSVADAAARREVRLPDGRTGWLLAVPSPRSRRRSRGSSPGAQARVALLSGAVISVPVTDVEVLT